MKVGSSRLGDWRFRDLWAESWAVGLMSAPADSPSGSRWRFRACFFFQALTQTLKLRTENWQFVLDDIPDQPQLHPKYSWISLSRMPAIFRHGSPAPEHECRRIYP